MDEPLEIAVSTETFAVLEGPLIDALTAYTDEAVSVRRGRDQVEWDTWRFCMAEEGFDFPQRPTVKPDPFAALELTDVNERDFVATYGYAISTVDTSRSRSTPTKTIQTLIGEFEAEGDLSFSAAFFRDSRLPFFDDFELVPGSENGGVFLDPESCYGKGIAAGEAWTQENHPDFESLEVLARAYNDVDGLYRTDGRTLELFESYASCMRNRGYELSPETPDGAVNLALQNLTQYIRSHGEPFSGSSSPEAIEALEELQATELAIAVASYECEGMIREELRVIYNDVETTWLARNPDAAATMALFETF